MRPFLCTSVFSLDSGWCKGILPWEQDSQAFCDVSSPCFWISFPEFPFVLLSSDWKRKALQSRMMVFLLLGHKISESHRSRSVCRGKDNSREGERIWGTGFLFLPWSYHTSLFSYGQHLLNFSWKSEKVHSLSPPSRASVWSYSRGGLCNYLVCFSL